MTLKLDKSDNLIRNKRFFLFAFLAIVVFLFQGAFSGIEKQSDINSDKDLDVDYIISDEVFTNINSMSIEQIQKFLESKNSPLANKNLYQYYYLTYPFDMEVYDLVFPNGKLARESSPAEIIYYSSNLQIKQSQIASFINPQILIVLLELNQGLIEGSSFLYQSNLDNALEFVPVDSRKDYINYQGFLNQLIGLASKLNEAFEYYKSSPKDNKPKTFIDGIIHYPKNAGTYALHKYLGSINNLYKFLILYRISSQSKLIFDYPVDKSIYIPGSYLGRSFYYDKIHLGEDIQLNEGTPIKAIADGRIVQYEYHQGYASWDDGTSIAAVIEHDLGETITLDLKVGHVKKVSVSKICSIYGHIRKSKTYYGEKLSWKVGDFIRKGDVIGYVNDGTHNGNGGVHLHMGIRLSGHPCALGQYCWVYFGYENTAKYPESNVKYFAAASEVIEKLSTSLISEDGQTVYYLQNNKIYHVIDPTVATIMTNAGMPGWTWPNFIITDLSPYIEGPEFIANDSRSNGLLIRQKDTNPVYLIQNGKRRWIQSQEALNWKGTNWTDDVIVVPSEIITNYVPTIGNSVYAVGEGEANSSIKNSFISAYNTNENDSYCTSPSSWKGWPGSFSNCLEFPISQVGDAYTSGYSGISGKYQLFGAESGEKGTINYSSKGSFSVYGAIYTKYKELGYSSSLLGFPTSNETWWNGNRRSNFEVGYIYWDPSTNQTHVVYENLSSITVTTSPSGLQTTVDGTNYTAPKTFQWVPGSTHTIGVSSPQSGQTGTRYLYSSWSDGGAQTHTITTPSTATTYTANFTTQYLLTTSVNPSGGGTVSPSGANWYNSGQSVSIQATPAPGYYFTGWSGDLTGTENPKSITMNGPKNVVANFALESYPEINIKQNTTDIPDGGSYDFGSHGVGTHTDTTFTIENTGTANLTLGSSPIITITGTNADQFSVQQQPTSPVTPGNSTTFIIRFSPTSTGAKTASISIANNDSNENPYDITLNGRGMGGYYVLDGYGGVHAGGGASALSPPTPYFGWDIAKDMELASTGYYVLDGYGGVHAGGGAPVMIPTAPYFGWDIAKDMELASTGYYVLDGYGGVHAGGGASAMTPTTPYFGWDIARDMELASTGYYVLDGYGGVHPGGGASAMTPSTPYFGWDIARDLELAATGYYVLDGYGGVHVGGGAPSMSPATPYFGWDIARDMELR